MGWYNWFSQSQRDKKWRDHQRRQAKGETFLAHGKCALCGDPNVDIEPHSEDYSEDSQGRFSWREPAVYYLCRQCHRTHLHKRFSNQLGWKTHLAHVRRGGYSADRRQPSIKRELARYRDALKRAASPPPLKGLGRRRRFSAKPWWERLTMDISSIRGPRR
jgi:hypothetical protein